MRQEYVFFNNRLTARLNEIIHKPLTVVCAHIGTGKTTAVKAYVDNLRCPVIWHSFSGEDFGEYVEDFFRLLSAEQPDLLPLLSAIERPGPGSSQQDVYLPNRVAAAMKMLCRRDGAGERLIYALDCPDTLSDRVADFLYTLSCQRVSMFHIVVMARHSAYFRFGRLMDNTVNEISESCLLLNMEDIQRSFQRHGVNLLPEEAALVFRYSDGWIPLVGKIFSQIRRAGQAETWTGLEALLTPYISLTLLPETMGYSPAAWKLLVRMCLRESFSGDDIQRIDEILQTPPEERVGLDALLSEHPAFLYYDEQSGSCHTNWLLSSRLLRLFDELAPGERARIAAAHILYGYERGDKTVEALRRGKMAQAVRGEPEIFPELDAFWDRAGGGYREQQDVPDELRQVWVSIARFQLDEAEERLNAMKRPVETERSVYLRLWGFLLVLRGEAGRAVRTLEKEMARSAAAGRAAQAESLSFGTLFLKLFLDADWSAGTEAYSRYAQKRLEEDADGGLLYDLILLRGEDKQRLSVLHEADSGAEGEAERAFLVFHQFFRVAGLWLLRRTERAKTVFAQAVSMARDGEFWLPMFFFYEILGELFCRKA